MEKSDIGTDTGVTNVEKFLPMFFGRQESDKTPLFAGKPSIYMAYLPRFAKIGGKLEPEKPCPWHAETYERGRLVVRYCEIGPDGHDGSHIGDRPRLDYIQKLRDWRAFQHRQRRRGSGEPALFESLSTDDTATED